MPEHFTFYLEMNSKEELTEVNSNNELSIIEAEIDDFRLNKFLYQHVGEPWGWVDKLTLPDDVWVSYVENPGLRTWVAYYRGAIAGYFELCKADNGDVEMVYFGLLEKFIGKGFGGYLLSEAIKKAWHECEARRVWLHTCTLDHPSALHNYQARGFKVYKKEQGLNEG